MSSLTTRGSFPASFVFVLGTDQNGNFEYEYEHEGMLTSVARGTTLAALG